MARLRPFRALRPRPEHAAGIAAVPYDVVNVDEARALASGNDLSFLHVSRAEIDLPSDVHPYDDRVYAAAARRFEELREHMLVEAEPSVYCYRLRMGKHEQTGIAACFSVEDYEANRILKHEGTRRDKEDDRTRHIVELRAQTGPVFLLFRHDNEVAAIVRRVCEGAPLYDFVADDGVAHTVWKASPADGQAIVTAFERLPKLYIADGHHRAASAARAHAAFAREGTEAGEQEHAWFLAVAFSDDQTQILAYNRVVRDLGGLSPSAFLERIRERFRVVEPGPAVPARRGECAMYLDGRWYTIVLAEPDRAEDADPIARLDVTRLQDGIVGPLLGIVDLRTDKRIDFVGGARGTAELERLVNTGQAAVAFSMFPVSVADLMAIADAGSIMPPKSTWFEPKLRDGLLSHLI